MPDLYGMAIWPDTDAHPVIDELRYESALEQRFAWLAHKYFRNRTLRSQVPVARYRLDFVFDQVAFECDGFRFHSSRFDQERDRLRDHAILESGIVNTIYRIPGRCLVFRPEDCFYAISRWDPDLFSDRGLINLKHLVSDEIHASFTAAYLPPRGSFRCRYPLSDDEQDMPDIATFEITRKCKA
jgi:very-short-patch-repair endonuclease